ncbi:MAG: 4Fe-4S dicluster domain-containing protein [Vicinamibacterales bacterium]
MPVADAAPSVPLRWGKIVDQTRCVGCHACTVACKSENNVPLSVTRTYVKSVDVGVFPQARRAFQVTRCNQCDDAPCCTACPTSAMARRHDGIVDFDKAVCIGCKACIAACPYDAIFINPQDHSAEKCNFCAHRLDVGLEPACVVVCPTEAILVGNLADPTSRVARMVHRDVVAVRRPEKETRPKLFYKGAHQTTLDPLAASRPAGGLFMWSQQGDVPHQVTSGHPDAGNSAAAAMLSYDVPHRAPWDWRVSLYTWTKSIAAGVYLAALVLIGFGSLRWSSALWQTSTPIIGGVALAATGLLLIADLEHPWRFYLIFTRPQFKSWLVRGAIVITGYAIVLGAHLAMGRWRPEGVPRGLAVFGTPLAAMTAIYTAYLFAQAKARDLWQSPLLPPHLLVQALLAGTAVLCLVAPAVEPRVLRPLTALLMWASLAHVLLVIGEMTMTHATAHARLAAHEITEGRYRALYRVALVLSAIAIFAPWVGPACAVPALAGLFAFEHAYVQGAQLVPLA